MDRTIKLFDRACWKKIEKSAEHHPDVAMVSALIEFRSQGALVA